MFSQFRRKEYHEDTIHHVKVKKGITILFSKTLKLLQHKHLQLDDAEFIYSNDASNNLCNVLEAVFLHGLKDSVTQKLTAYVGLAASSLDTTSGLNFWNVAAKFTHKDVIVQLQSLSQITTPIGWCRAWVRMALNDGLMQSYLHSMIVDVKTLKYFYHSFAYLRDFEQPGILNNLLTVLEEYHAR
ncbi:pleckstriny domain-containing family M member 1 [Biomphalaria glabrata]|nr:pleckstriny domain-containing family M member 1 [Biomphalaria glabrata]